MGFRAPINSFKLFKLCSRTSSNPYFSLTILERSAWKNSGSDIFFTVLEETRLSNDDERANLFKASSCLFFSTSQYEPLSLTPWPRSFATLLIFYSFAQNGLTKGLSQQNMFVWNTKSKKSYCYSGPSSTAKRGKRARSRKKERK